MTNADYEAVAAEVRAAYREGWQPWELPEVAKSVMRSRGLPMEGARRLAFNCTADLRPTGQRLNEDA